MTRKVHRTVYAYELERATGELGWDLVSVHTQQEITVISSRNPTNEERGQGIYGSVEEKALVNVLCFLVSKDVEDAERDQALIKAKTTAEYALEGLQREHKKCEERVGSLQRTLERVEATERDLRTQTNVERDRCARLIIERDRCAKKAQEPMDLLAKVAVFIRGNGTDPMREALADSILVRFAEATKPSEEPSS